MNQAPRAMIALLVLLPVACKGCQKQEVPQVTLAQEADKVIFASVEKIGAHRYIGRVTRADSRDGGKPVSHEETVDLGWEDWDNFRYSRLINGEPAFEVLVANSVPYIRRGTGRWEQRDDVEPYRVELESTWDTWDEAMEPFGYRVALTDQGTEVIEGRPTTRYAVSLAPVPEVKGKGKKKGGATHSHFEPLTLSGTVWVDQTTAVRLVGDVSGSVQQGNLTRTIALRFARSGFGEKQDIAPPPMARKARGTDGVVTP